MEMDFETNSGRMGIEVIVRLSNAAVTTFALNQSLSESIANAASNPCLITNVRELIKLPTCGNGICEMGEARGIGGDYLCPADCAFVFTSCPSKQEGNVGSFDIPCSGNGAFGYPFDSMRLSRTMPFCRERPL